MQRTVLLVDDDMNITSALRRTIRSKNKEWQIHFMNTAEEALEYMAARPVHILLSDIRMPGKDGFHLLKTVMEKYPHTVRVIFSGHYQEESQLDSIRFAHQYLAKPVEAAKITDVINEIICLQNLMNSPAIEAEIGSLTSLPTLPDVYIELLRSLKSEEPSMKQIASLIKSDVALTARVMQMVNSAFFGIPHRVTKCEQAVTLLGLENIRNLILSIQFFSIFESGPIPMKNIESLWEHSILVAGLSGGLAKAEGLSLQQIEVITLAGMLHDIGKLIFLKLSEYRNILAKHQGVSMLDELDTERSLTGCSHAEAGAYLLGVWGLDKQVVHAVRDHHYPERELASPGLTPALALHVANYLINNSRPTVVSRTIDLSEPALARAGLQGRLAGWREMAQ